MSRTCLVTVDSDRPTVRRRAAWLLAGFAAVLVGAAAPPAVAQAATLTVSGVVFHDRNDNGVRDPGEAGVPGIRVRHGAGHAATTTGASGAYRLTGLPASGKVLVETGWLRSQCPASGSPAAITCPTGPGRDNDFAVDNQFIGYPLTGRVSATGVDVGLLPDWPGAVLSPPLTSGAVPANAVDVAARLSWTAGTCVAGSSNICRRGDTFQLAAQVYNQGTTALTGISTVLSVPAGDCITGLSLVAAATSPGLTAMAVTPPADQFSCATRIVAVALRGALVAGGAARIAVTGTTAAGPGTPGCRIDAVDPGSCTVAEPQGRGWLFAVSHIDQSGDPDSTFCAAAADPQGCPTGVHDKRRAPDEVDPVGHNVDAALGGGTSYNLQTHLSALTRPVRAGRPVTLRAWVSNAVGEVAGNQAPPGTSLTLHLPAGTQVTAVPVKHFLLACTASGTTVTCRYRGPLSPHLAGVAIDVTVLLPQAWPAGRLFHPVACATPPAGAAREAVPASACGPATVAADTVTDNDADVTSPVGVGVAEHRVE